MSYATLAELRAALDHEAGITVDDADLQRALDAATEWINNECGRTFGVSGSTTKYFIATDPNTLAVQDLVTATSVTVDTNGDDTYPRTLTTANYYLWPLNDARYQEIRIKPTSSLGFSPQHKVKVIGTFGYVEAATVPVSIKQACLFMATRWFKRHEAPFGVLQNSAIDAYMRISGRDPDVDMLLLRYRANTSGAASWVLV